MLKNMVLLELFPVVVSVVLWGKDFANKRKLVNTDNKDVLYAINCLASNCALVVRLLPFLVLLCLCMNIWIKARHIPGSITEVTDSLSHFQFSRFRALVPWADSKGKSCPEYVLKHNLVVMLSLLE